MNVSRHFFSETRMRLKPRFSHAFLPPTRFHALVLPLLDTSSPPSAFSVHPLFSCFCYYICSPSPANLCLSMIHLFSPSSSLFLFLCCFSSFSLIISRSELFHSAMWKVHWGGGVFLGTTPLLLTQWEMVSLLQQGIRFHEELEYICKSDI